MKNDFRVWFELQGKPLEPENMLPEDVNDLPNGRYEARCRSCGNWYELPYALEEFTAEGNYCNSGSSFCQP